jgi:hypothetical protein
MIEGLGFDKGVDVYQRSNSEMVFVELWPVILGPQFSKHRLENFLFVFE